MATTTYGSPYVENTGLVSAWPGVSLNVAQRIDAVSYAGNGVNAQTGTTYTLVLTDAGKNVTLSNASSVTVTVPTFASVAYPVGTVINLTNLGAGTVTVAAAGTVTVNGSPLTLAQYTQGQLLNTASNTWVFTSGPTVTAPGLVQVTPTSIANSGGSASLSGGTLTFTGVSSVSLNGAFTSTYENYRIIVQLTGSSTNLELRARTRLAGSDDTGSNYFTSLYYIGTTGAAAGSTVGSATTSWSIFAASESTDTNNWGFFDLVNPLSSKRKQASGMASVQNPGSVGYGNSIFHNKIVTTTYDGLTLLTSTGTCTGTIRIYGYKN